MKVLSTVLALSLVISAPIISLLPPMQAAQAQTQPSVATIEASAFKQVNDYRVSQGLAPLQQVSYISDVARQHSANMASGAVAFGHDGFSARVTQIRTQMTVSAAAENVAYNQGYSDPATTAVQGWLNSSGHLANIRGNYTKAGLGVAVNSKGEYYFTQIFIR
jgi:uncharacterized protein YkwD